MSDGFKQAVWYNGKRSITGKWRYNWGSDSFTIILDSIDRITGHRRSMIVYGDCPEWGNWKRNRSH